VGESTAGFRGRARFEADRYGSDRWVFVRELLQNARDAGATRVAFSIEGEAGRDRIRCRDDGCGMTFEHARRYLFTLYASMRRGWRVASGSASGRCSGSTLRRYPSDRGPLVVRGGR
jgi:hypothetical protein